MLNFPMTSLTNNYPNATNESMVPQSSNLHILNWPHDILRIIGRLLPRQDAITFTSTCVLLFTLRFKAGGHGILYGQCWKRIPLPREAICSRLVLEGRTTAAWPTVKNYAPAITALTLNFTSLSLPELASVTADLKDLAMLTTLNIECLRLQEDLVMALMLTACQFSNLQSLTINSYTLTLLPAELGQLEHLQSLKINAYKLTTLPAELGQLKCLQSLTIQAFQLMILPTELWQLPLKILNISRLTTLPAELGQLKWLQSLEIHTNTLTTLPAELGKLKCLKDLTIYANSLITLPTELGQLNNLQKLIVWASSSFTLPPEIECLKMRGLQIQIQHY